MIFLCVVSVDQIQGLRKEYSSVGLDESSLPSTPMELFQEWMDQAVQAQLTEPNAMFLSTVDADGQPHGRVVLLKEIEGEGFVFYTNYESDKGRQLAAHPKANACFWWADLERSVRVVGTVEKISEKQSAEYFAKRPRGSQIGAWASRQSSPVIKQGKMTGRDILDGIYQSLEEKFKDVETIPKPEYWGGYKINATSIEFWKGRKSRLHDRIRYIKQSNGSWSKERLQP